MWMWWRLRIRLRPLNVDAALWVSWQCVCQTKHTVRPENTPESDTCLKVKFNLIKISAQAKTLRGSVYSCCRRLVWRWSTARMPNEVNTHRRRSKRGGELVKKLDTQRWIGTGGGCRGSPLAFLCSVFYTFFFLCPGGIITLWSALALDEMSFVKRCTRS